MHLRDHHTGPRRRCKHRAHMAPRRARVPCVPADEHRSKRKTLCDYLEKTMEELHGEMVTFMEEPSDNQLRCVKRKCKRVRNALKEKGKEYIELSAVEISEARQKEEHRVVEIEGGLYSCTRATEENGVLVCRCAKGKGFSGFRPAKRRKDAVRHCKRANLPLTRKNGDEYRELCKLDDEIADWLE